MKKIIITGASGFLGTETVNFFLEKGHKVIALIHNKKSAAHLPVHPGLQVEVMELTNETAVASGLTLLIKQHKTIDAALLLAGGYEAGDIGSTTVAAIKKQIQLNFETAFGVVKALYPHFFSNRKGRFVFIGAQAPLMPKKARQMVAYSLSKSLLFQLANIINEDSKGTNIVAAIIVPSTIDTKANREAMPATDTKKWVKPAQLVEAMEFICSDKADAIREPLLKIYNDAL